jgi:hypothetical protein
VTTEERFQSFRQGFNSAEQGYIDDCWIIFKMGVEFGTLYDMDMEEEMPQLPFDVSVKQGYMIRQSLFDLAIYLENDTAQ